MFDLFLYMSIVINNQEINEYYDNNIFKKNGLSNSRSEISVLGYSPSYEINEFYDRTGRQINRGKVKIQGELFIYAGSNKYSIKGLTDAEFWWLGKELSEFLDLELEIIHDTPIISSVSPR